MDVRLQLERPSVVRLVIPARAKVRGTVKCNYKRVYLRVVNQRFINENISNMSEKLDSLHSPGRKFIHYTTAAESTINLMPRAKKNDFDLLIHISKLDFIAYTTPVIFVLF